MRATAIEFRLRMAINAATIILGFWAPWIEQWGIGRRISVLEWLALALSRYSIASFAIATPIVIIAAACIAALGAVLRVWGTAYLGTSTVHNLNMKAGTVMADGPYRFVRNPLYLGLWLMVVAMGFIMPPTGALCAIFFITIFAMRLIFGEEAFLSTELGEPYKVYLRDVPRLFPRLRTNVASAGARPRWLRAVMAELTPIGVFVALAFLSWTYDNRLMGRAILVSFGLSLVTRALLPPEAPSSAT
ncbi:MAG TPA: isoprenylcysteine carboxylmethyltransferase family protein [Terracidiphilus sp.]|nr:isoprenylcysteine carboxylmethyltransferase family protein [Terracidiphilus sp.]